MTRAWVLYEYEDGVYRITVPVRKPRPLEDYLKLQGRFRHLLRPENKWMLDLLKQDVEIQWERISKLAEITSKTPLRA